MRNRFGRSAAPGGGCTAPTGHLSTHPGARARPGEKPSPPTRAERAPPGLPNPRRPPAGPRDRGRMSGELGTADRGAHGGRGQRAGAGGSCGARGLARGAGPAGGGQRSPGVEGSGAAGRRRGIPRRPVTPGRSEGGPRGQRSGRENPDPGRQVTGGGGGGPSAGERGWRGLEATRARSADPHSPAPVTVRRRGRRWRREASRRGHGERCPCPREAVGRGRCRPNIGREGAPRMRRGAGSSAQARCVAPGVRGLGGTRGSGGGAGLPGSGWGQGEEEGSAAGG